ncbi:MAG: arginine N-succinyltransferase, partial [Acidimicrobiales bacterium]
SLSADIAFNEKRLLDAEAAMDTAPGELARFLFVLEDLETQQILGTTGIGVRGHHLMPAFLVEPNHTFSRVPHHHFDAGAIMKSHLADGCGELQSLFLKAHARGGGMGTLLSRSRLMLMAQHTDRFPAKFVSELRGVASQDGSFPFWEGLGRHFTGLSSREAEEVVASGGTMALGQMLPDGPIPISLLEADARAALEKVHPSTQGAKRLLLVEGFEMRGLANVLDAGPMPMLTIEDSVSVRHSVHRTVHIGDPRDPRRTLMANTRWNEFRAALGEVEIRDQAVTLDGDLAQALRVDEGDELRILTLGGG